MIFKISTYQEGKKPKFKYHFYVQSKGNNAGRPLREPKANCWLVETDILLAYEICTVLWVSKMYEQEIIGSVIPFMRINEYLKITMPYLSHSEKHSEAIQQGLKSISNIDLLIDTSLSKLNLIKELKIVTAYQLLKKIHSEVGINEETPV